MLEVGAWSAETVGRRPTSQTLAWRIILIELLSIREGRSGEAGFLKLSSINHYAKSFFIEEIFKAPRRMLQRTLWSLPISHFPTRAKKKIIFSIFRFLSLSIREFALSKCEKIFFHSNHWGQESDKSNPDSCVEHNSFSDKKNRHFHNSTKHKLTIFHFLVLITFSGPVWIAHGEFCTVHTFITMRNS